MTPSDELFKLIKSMHRTEKRYFKVYASKHTIGEKNNYVKLFDAIDDQEQYDEAEIKRIFAKATLIKYFPAEKQYLYEIVLKSLRAYHEEKFSVDFKLRSMLNSVEILYDKNLFSQGEKILFRAKKMAIKYQKHNMLIEVFSWERKFMRISSYKAINLEEHTKEVRTIFQKSENHTTYSILYSKIHQFVHQKTMARSERELKKVNEVMKHPLLKSSKEALSDLSALIYNNIYIAYYSTAVRDLNKAYPYAKRSMEIVTQHPELLKDDPNQYINILFDFTGISSETGHIQDVYKVIAGLRTLPAELSSRDIEHHQERAFILSCLLELHMYIVQGQFDKGAKFIDENAAAFLKKENDLDSFNVVMLYYNISYVYMGAREYSKALKWANRLINNLDTAKFSDFHCFTKILILIIHFELGNDELLPYIVKSTYRFLLRHEQLYKVEIIIIDYIRKKFSKVSRHDKPALIKIFKSFKEDLIKVLQNDAFEKRSLEFFDFISWLDSHIQKKPFAEIIQAKSKKPIDK